VSEGAAAAHDVLLVGGGAAGPACGDRDQRRRIPVSAWP
jgi:hypothetical protein